MPRTAPRRARRRSPDTDARHRCGVDHHKQVWVIENICCGIEVHRRFLDVSARLNAIPLEFHASMLYGIAVERHPCPLVFSHLMIRKKGKASFPPRRVRSGRLRYLLMKSALKHGPGRCHRSILTRRGRLRRETQGTAVRPRNRRPPAMRVA
jgi:hypothetical protein